MELNVSKAEKKIFTDSNIEIKNCYSSGPLTVLPAPGQFPFTRSILPTLYRDKLWTMRQYAGFSTAEESNKRYHYLLQQGTSGLSVAFDLPTQIGYDSSHDLAEGEVGKVGVAIDSLEDMELLFKDIKLQDITTSMTINATGFILLAFYIALAKRQQADLKLIGGTIQNDILKEYAARGTYIYPPKPSMRIITDIFEYCSTELPRWNTISISGYHIREAGSNALQELAFTLANGKAYLKAAIEKGLDINVFAKRLSFFFNAHNNLLEEVSKFRAARALWAEITKELGATDPKAQMLRFHTQTGGSTLTAQQPENNIVRVTIQALAAVLGGTQSLHTNGFDEALSLPTEAAARTALRTQQIIAFESGVADTVDPLAGSFAVESITAQLIDDAKALILRIDEMGGAVSAIEQGFMQGEIALSAYQYQKNIENGSKIIVGVNKFETIEPPVKNLFSIGDEIRQIQIDKLNKLKAKRNSYLVQTCLNKLEHDAINNINIMPAVIECAENYCTLGEIADVLRKQFGEFKG
jgi:methylmalonyl-CoA mutase N-terminal domain/subunit